MEKITKKGFSAKIGILTKIGFFKILKKILHSFSFLRQNELKMAAASASAAASSMTKGDAELIVNLLKELHSHKEAWHKLAHAYFDVLGHSAALDPSVVAALEKQQELAFEAKDSLCTEIHEMAEQYGAAMVVLKDPG